MADALTKAVDQSSLKAHSAKAGTTPDKGRHELSPKFNKLEEV